MPKPLGTVGKPRKQRMRCDCHTTRFVFDGHPDISAELLPADRFLERAS
jgi:hypothetical protein